jgi:hypothetical protein
MTINSSTRIAGPYTGNGSTTAFPFSFKVFSTAEVSVVQTNLSLVETTLTLGTNYTVSLNANQNSNPGGTVNMVSAPASGFLITLTSSLGYTQTLDLTNQGGFYPSTINDALDRATIQIQQLNEQVGRSVKVNISSSVSPADLINTIISSAASSTTSATNAATSASNAATSATSASGSATSASTSASTATTQASAASTSATNAAASASTATTQAALATTNGAAQVALATTQATNASTSATSAATSATTATTQATNASSSASSASTSATNASTSATTASTAATTATTQATAAGTSATNAATSATAAAASAASVGFTLTSTSTLTNKTLTAPVITNSLVTGIRETATVSATAATGTVQFDALTQVVLYYTTNASGNFTLNFRGNSGATLDSVMSTGQSLSATFLAANGSTAYYNSALTVDGTSVTPKWQGGTAPTSGNASAIDSYTYVIIKTGSAAFTVLASQTKFA